MSPNILTILSIILAYLVGSIPFGILAGKLGGVDVRTVGSGNIGATNVWRALGPTAGITVFLLDVAKGFSGPLIGNLLLGKDHHWGIALCALFAVLGHVFSLFLKFKGGKGIATGLGAMLGLWPLGAVAAFGVWVVILLASRMVSLSSVLACFFLPIFAWFYHIPPAFALIITLFCLIAIIKHTSNIQRIIAGTESRVSFGRKKDDKSTF